MHIYMNKIDISLADKVKSFLLENGFVVKVRPYTVFRARSSTCTVSLYESGKLLMQGSEVAEVAQKFEAYMGLTPTVVNFVNAETVSRNYSRYIGISISGRIDFFGPLVVSGVLITPENKDLFIELGVDAYKKLNDDMIKKIASEIKKFAIYSTVVISPLEYNELYDYHKTSQKISALGHVKVIDDILKKEKCEYAISNKLVDNEFIQELLTENAIDIKVDQFCRGEEDIALSAAFIIARAEFIDRIQTMEKNYGLTILRGSNRNITKCAQIFCDKYGKNRLNEVAKIHFRTVQNLK